MGKTLVVWGNLTDAANISNNTFACIGGGQQFPGSLSVSGLFLRDAGTFSFLGYNNRRGGGTNTVRFNVAGASGNQVVAQAGTGWLEDTTNTDVVAADTTVQLGFTDSGTNPCYSVVKMCFEASADTVAHQIASNAAVNYDVPSATRFLRFAGTQVADGIATEAQAQVKVRAAGTVESLHVRVSANARTNNSDFTVRVNGSNGAGTVQFGAGVTGVLYDDTHTDAVASGDLLCGSITLSTGTEDLNVTVIACVVRNTAGLSDLFFEAPDGTVGRAASATSHYTPLGGAWPWCNPGTTTEANVSLKVGGFDGTISNLRAYIQSNTYSGSCQIRIFKNGSAALTLTIAAGATGWQENTVDTLQFVAGDTLSYEINGGTAGILVMRVAGITFGPAGGGSAVGGAGAIFASPVFNSRVIQGVAH